MVDSRTIVPESLRIGNIIRHERIGFYAVTGYDIARFDNPKKKDWAEKFSVIGLTKDLLWKCGCVKEDFGWVLYRKVGICVTFRWITHTVGKKIITPFARFDGLADVYCVHHLQNLYYDIACESLKINL